MWRRFRYCTGRTVAVHCCCNHCATAIPRRKTCPLPRAYWAYARVSEPGNSGFRFVGSARSCLTRIYIYIYIYCNFHPLASQGHQRGRLPIFHTPDSTRQKTNQILCPHPHPPILIRPPASLSIGYIIGMPRGVG